MVQPLRLDKAKQGFDKAIRCFGKFAGISSKQPVVQTSDLKDAAVDSVEKLTAKKPDPYEEAIAEYNGAFTSMNDKGLSLLCQRERSTDLIELVELLVNNIAHTPKAFETDFDEIDIHKRPKRLDDAGYLRSQEFDLLGSRPTCTAS